MKNIKIKYTRKRKEGGLSLVIGLYLVSAYVLIISAKPNVEGSVCCVGHAHLGLQPTIINSNTQCEYQKKNKKYFLGVLCAHCALNYKRQTNGSVANGQFSFFVSCVLAFSLV